MSYLGWFLAVCGLVGVVVGLMQMLKGKKMGTVPFKKPSEIAQQGMQAGDAKQMVSTEGQVQQGPQPLIAPMSGQACLAYEIAIERKWEKHERTENGDQKTTGSENVHRESKGSLFQLSDGTAAVFVDSSGSIDADMDKTHSSTISVGMMIPGTLSFGQMQLNTPHITSTESRTTAFVGTEKAVKVSPTVYALGQLQQGSQGPMIGTPKGIGTGKLILSAKGREALMGKTKRNMILGYAIGGALFVGGTLMGVLGPAPEPGQASCGGALATDVVSCSGRLYDAAGQTMEWTVPATATYTISVKQPKVKYPIYGDLTITDGAGKQVGKDTAQSKGDVAKVTGPFAAGKYKIVVKDRDGGIEFKTLKGGFGYELVIEKQGGGAAGGSGAAAAGAKPAAAAAKPAAVPAATGAPAAKPGPAPAKPAPAPKK